MSTFMNFFNRWFRRRPRPARAPVDESPPGPLARLIGPPESDAPIVALPVGEVTMILDRMAYEYQKGLTPGHDPSQAELDAALARADRVRVLEGGMFRERALGTEVLLDTSRRVEVDVIRDLFVVVEDPETFGHCLCLGGPTFEFYAGKEPLATLASHHGGSIRWPRWKHDARLRDPDRLRDWFQAHGIAIDDGPRSQDSMSMALLALTEADRHVMRADSHRRRGEFRQATDEVARAFEVDPAYPLAFGLRGMLRGETGRHAEAEADCTEAIRQGLEIAEVFLARAFARDAQGRPEDALLDCDVALKLDPGHAVAHNSRAVIRAKTGKVIEALADYGKAMDLGPDWPTPAGNRGILHLTIGRFREAVSDLTEAIRRFETASASRPPSRSVWVQGDATLGAYHGARGEAFAALGDDEDALADYQKAVDLGPEDPRARLARGQFLFHQGEIDAALADFDERSEEH
ncbi:MAG: tetratricopeptide repeat protein, partial [Isosphaeraceae bacterium]